MLIGRGHNGHGLGALHLGILANGAISGIVFDSRIAAKMGTLLSTATNASASNFRRSSLVNDFVSPEPPFIIIADTPSISAKELMCRLNS